MALLPVRCSQQELQPPQVVSTADACDPFHGCGVGSRLEAALHARRNSTSAATQTLYDPSIVSPVASTLHVRRSASAAASRTSSGGSVRWLESPTDVPPAAAESRSIQSAKDDAHDQQLRQQLMLQHKQKQQQHHQQLLDVQRELALAQRELSSARSSSLSQATSERQQEVHAAAAAAAAAADIHRAGLDAILQRLGSWDADVLAEVYRNGQLAAAHAPQQHQQQLLTSPPSVTDVSISMKYVIKLGRNCHHYRHKQQH